MKRVVGVIAAGVYFVTGCVSQPGSDSARLPNAVVTPAPAPAPAPSPAAPKSDSTPAAATPSTSAPPTDARVIARINGEAITLHELLEPLLASRGLALLLNIAQLDLAKQDLRAQHLAISDDDVHREQNITLEKLFHDRDQKEQDRLADAELKKDTEKANQIRVQMHEDREKFLDQYLDTQHVSRVEYDTVVAINACLRKAAEAQVVPSQITDEMVEQQFGREYGETARCRVIQLANAHEVQDAQRRLKTEAFEDVARSMSRNARTRDLGGEMQPFSLQTQALPPEFRQLAFSLQPGQVSDMLVLGDNFYLIKLEQKFAPKAVKFADVKDAIRKEMYDLLTEKAMTNLRENLGQQAMKQLSIADPLLSKQFDDLKAKQEGAIKEREKINEQLKKEREDAAAAAATQVAPAPPATPATMPATAPASAPATQPGPL